ncbi:S8 family serine peptidase [Archangium sp.]|uniref:S8 family serine peptidase n=1 Tax=Archangium sp. TaxID=1872627 RepID=UPI003899FAC1
MSETSRRPWVVLALAAVLSGCGSETQDAPVSSESVSAPSAITVQSLQPAQAEQKPKFRRATHAKKARYVVVLAEEGLDEAKVKQKASAQAARHGGKVLRHYAHALRGWAGELSEAEARRLSEDPEVAFVEEDGEFTLTESTQETPPSWGLGRVDERYLPYTDRFHYSWTGSGVNAYVIDSGIRATHVDFGGRVRHDFTAIQDGWGAGDCAGHGTHVAGTIGGATYGVAKSVLLHSVRIFGCPDAAGHVTSSTEVILSGVDWVAANHVKPAVANMSLGGGASDAMDQGVRNLIARGVTVVVAAGNSNVDACTQSPARVGEAITVAATDINDARASFSNWGSCVDVFAPGVDIVSAYHGNDTYQTTMSGTSMATPHVAGAVAQYLQAQPGAAPANSHNAIVGESTPGVVSNAGAGTPNRMLFTHVVPPAAPRGLYAAARSPWQVEIDWYDNSELDLAGYLVYRGSTLVGWIGRDSHFWDNGLAGNSTYGYTVRAYNWYGQQSGSTGTFSVTTPVDPASAVPLYQYFNGTNTDHFYTVSRNDAGYGYFGYGYEAVAARVLTWGAQGAVPLWRYWNPTNGDHFYTVDRNDSGYAAYGYSYDGSEGYAYREQRWGTVPLYRYWNGTGGDHYYTTNRNDAGYGYYGYGFERVEAWVYPP